MAAIQKHLGPYLRRVMFQVPSRQTHILRRMQEILHSEYTVEELKIHLKTKIFKNMQEDQKFRLDRYKILGPDLSAAHFLVARGGSVKFENDHKWHKLVKNKVFLPRRMVEGMFIEAADAADTSIMYEGFENFTELTRIRYLSLKNCEYVDDWCLDRLHAMGNTLDFLDLSGCTHISERGIASLHKLQKLEALVLKDLPNLSNLEMIAVMLQDVLPDCRILTSSLAEQTPNEHLSPT